MKTVVAAILALALAVSAGAREFLNVREIDIRPAIDAHYDDGRLLDLDKALYRLGEIVRTGPPGAEQFAVVIDCQFDGKRWTYTLREVRFERSK